MDDLKIIEAALTKPEPSSDTIDRRRHQLQNAMREPVRARRSRRPFIAIGVTAATAVAAVTVVTSGGESPGQPGDRSPVVQMSGRQALLAAATAAEAGPGASGKYWHVERTRLHSGEYPTFESWTMADGRQWSRVGDGPVAKVPGRHPIVVPGTDLGMAEIAELPTAPAEMKSALLDTEFKNPETPKEMRTLFLLTGLLSRVPAPPKVRATALRVLATLPDVVNTGKADDGQSLVFAWKGGGPKLIVNPKTAAIRTEGSVGANGEAASTGLGVTARWTDELPR
ncbi:CU044_5270 family protein [Actinomadura sp. LOL_016]|uniref:CU044_5270 family protein n=1 Tax=unclassified Actinomadura TaxID=2626254 RepID=UPI003A80EBE2